MDNLSAANTTATDARPSADPREWSADDFAQYVRRERAQRDAMQKEIDALTAIVRRHFPRDFHA